MSSTLNVVAAGKPATSQGALATQAASELNQLNAGAAAAEAKADVPTSTLNADGTRTWHETVGLTVDDVELLEYLPPNLPIHKGDSVNFDASGTTVEPHTVSTPTAGPYLPFLPSQCESASGSDTPANPNVAGPPETGCPNPSGYEQPFLIGSQGAQTDLANLGTAASTLISGRPDFLAFGAQKSHTYRLTGGGTYAFFCFFHQNMGAIVSVPGYRLGGVDGSVYTEGSLDFAGAGSSQPNQTVVALPTTIGADGYWVVDANGATKAFGTAGNVGNVPAKLTSPIVGAAPTQDGQGLWLAAKDGGVFALGDAAYMGSLGGKHLNAPIVGITTDPNGAGYDLVASDGGVFTFGTNQNGGSRFYGSLGGKHLNAPIVGIADNFDDTGYILAASDGGIFTFGDVAFKGSLGATHLNSPIVGIAITADTTGVNNLTPGYRLVAADGGVFTFDASFEGSQGGNNHLNGPIVAIGGDSP